jgi:ribosome-binding factor A
MSRRTDRVNDLLRQELSALIQRELKDPRLGSGLTTVTEVDVSPDLKRATVYVSHLGDEGERENVLRALASASHFLQSELTKRLSLRHVPEFFFRFDPSIERGARLAELIQRVSRERPGDAS